MKAGKGKYVLGSILVAVVTLYLVYAFALRAIGQHLIAEEPIKSADVIVVIGHDKTGERVEHAVRLFKQGLGKYLIISGQNILWKTNSADFMKQHALTLGIRDEVILVDRNGKTLSVQAEHVRTVMEDKRLKSAILVTSSYRSARSLDAFMSALTPAGISVISSPPPTIDFDPGVWWMSRKGSKTLFIGYWDWIWDAEEG
jgi:uncharacterized SAM-binding protein YcdF (DUF218 family)